MFVFTMNTQWGQVYIPSLSIATESWWVMVGGFVECGENAGGEKAGEGDREENTLCNETEMRVYYYTTLCTIM